MDINEIYRKIPQSHCKQGCYKCCINSIQFTPEEEKNMGGYEYNGQCPYLVNGKCIIYEKRPFVCRIYGTSELLKCEDCISERYLSEEETKLLIREYMSIKKKQEKCL